MVEVYLDPTNLNEKIEGKRAFLRLVGAVLVNCFELSSKTSRPKS